LEVAQRPELRDVRSSLVTPGGLVSDVITLSGLDAGAAMRLAANVIGAADLPAAVAAMVLATIEGNPLCVGELVRMLVDEAAIEPAERMAMPTRPSPTRRGSMEGPTATATVPFDSCRLPSWI
jgi:hypothetical protein